MRNSLSHVSELIYDAITTSNKLMQAKIIEIVTGMTEEEMKVRLVHVRSPINIYYMLEIFQH